MDPPTWLNASEVALAIGEFVHAAELDPHRDARVLADQIASLGPSAIPALIDVLAARELLTQEGSLPLTSLRGALLLEALVAQPRASTIDVVRKRARGNISDGQRVALLLVLEWLSESTPQIWIEAAGGAGKEREVAPRVGDAFERTLGTALARAPQRSRQWEALPEDLSASLVAPLARALGRSGKNDGQAALERLLRSRPAAAAIVLAELRVLLTRAPVLRFPETLELVRSFLSSDLEAATLEAAQICGLVGDDRVVPDLIRLLEHSSFQVQGKARDALARLSGQRFPRDFAAWECWYTGEQAWFAGEGRARMAGLAARPAADFVRELRALLEHRIFRRELGQVLTRCLDRPEEGIVITTCAALAELRAPGAAEGIATLVHHSNAAIRLAARQAWTALHGQALLRSEEEATSSRPIPSAPSSQMPERGRLP